LQTIFSKKIKKNLKNCFFKYLIKFGQFNYQPGPVFALPRCFKDLVGHDSFRAILPLGFDKALIGELL